MRVEIRRVSLPYRKVFRIAYEAVDVAEVVRIELHDGAYVGRGEATGVSYLGETAGTLSAQLDSVRQALEAGVTRDELQELLPAGGARNAVDCALWDLEAKRAGKRAWELAGIAPVRPLRTAFTLGIDEPKVLAAGAIEAARYSLLKIKLGGGDGADLARVRAVRAARPDVDLIVDANQGWSIEELQEIVPQLATLGVRLIEQPLPKGKDDALAGFCSPVPLCADESCQTTASLPAVLGKYTHVNVKLDKAGGLTEALQLARAARQAGLGVMVGCMAGSSLAMAPGFVVGQLCEVVDLDGPLLAVADVEHAIRYDGSNMPAPDVALWG